MTPEKNPGCSLAHSGPCPEPYQLYAQAQEQTRAAYIKLMEDHGHLIPGKRPPGEDIFGHERRG